LVLLLTICVFLAMACGGLALYWIVEARRDSFTERLKEMAAPPLREKRGWGKGIMELFSGSLERRRKKEFVRNDFVEMATGAEFSGTRRMLIQAGFRHRSAYRIYILLRVILPIFIFFSAVLFMKSRGLPNTTTFTVGILAALFGFILPITIVRWKVVRRQEEITDGLPDALDLIVVCVEAGQGLNAAFLKISEEFRISSPLLSEEFDIVNREMVAGKPRQEALRALVDRTGVEEVKSFVAMLIQTEKLGTSLAHSLRVHSDSLRTKRMQRAEEAAAKTAIKLVFPLVFLLFPALFIVILGPGVIQVVRILFPAIMGGG